MSSSPWDTYANALEPRGYGYPLWAPEPSPEFGEVTLCDVGYIQRGRFCFLFNAANRERNRRGLPDGFEWFSYKEDEVQKDSESTPLYSVGIEPTEVALPKGEQRTDSLSAFASDKEYRCTKSTGALVLVGNGHVETKTLPMDKLIKEYILKHVASWRDFARNKLKIDIEEKDIIFVSGFTKTAEWGTIAFRDATPGPDGSRLVIKHRGAAPEVASGEQWLVTMANAPNALLFARAGPVNRGRPGSTTQPKGPTGTQVQEDSRANAEGDGSMKTKAEVTTDVKAKGEVKKGVEEDAEARVEVKMDQCIFLQYHRVKSRLLRSVSRVGDGRSSLT